MLCNAQKHVQHSWQRSEQDETGANSAFRGVTSYEAEEALASSLFS